MSGGADLSRRSGIAAGSLYFLPLLASFVCLAGAGIALILVCAEPRNQDSDLRVDFSRSTQSVCEVLRNLDRMPGQRIQVRGIYYSGLRQNGCGWRFTMGGREWPFALDMADASSGSHEGIHFGFTTDRASWDHLDRLAIRQGLSGVKAEIWVTVTGQLRGPQRSLVPNSGLTGGLGPYNVYPGQVVVERVHSVEVKTIPTYDYALVLPPYHLQKQAK